MPTMFAKIDAPSLVNLLENLTGVFSRPDMLAHPVDLASRLQELSAVWAVVFLTAGLVCMLSGYRFYKTIVVLLALAIGVFAGYYLGKKINAEYVVAGCLGALLAVCVFPLMKYAVALIGGLVGAFIGANSWSAISRMLQSGGKLSDQAADNIWIGALVGLLVCGMLAFILFKVSVVLSTSVSGSTLAVMGALALLMQVQPWQKSVSEGISTHAMVVPLLVVVPAVIGFILQVSKTVSPKHRKKEEIQTHGLLARLQREGS